MLELSFSDDNGLFPYAQSVSVLKLSDMFGAAPSKILESIRTNIRPSLATSCRTAFYRAFKKTLVQDRAVENKRNLMSFEGDEEYITKISVQGVDRKYYDLISMSDGADEFSCRRYWLMRQFGDYIIYLQDAHIQICGYRQQTFHSVDFHSQEDHVESIISSIPAPLLAFYVCQVRRVFQLKPTKYVCCYWVWSFMCSTIHDGCYHICGFSLNVCELFDE